MNVKYFHQRVNVGSLHSRPLKKIPRETHLSVTYINDSACQPFKGAFRVIIPRFHSRAARWRQCI